MANYEIAATILTIFHASLVLLLVLGIFVSFFIKKFRPVESFVLISAIIIWSLYGGCPLTYLEQWLRQHTAHPIPLTAVGFIPYYIQQWFHVSLAPNLVTIATYLAAGVLFLLTIDWELPLIEQVVKRLRKHHSTLKEMLHGFAK